MYSVIKFLYEAITLDWSAKLVPFVNSITVLY